MSKKKPRVILGPDGRPYVAPPKRAVAEAEVGGGSVIPNAASFSITLDRVSMDRYVRSVLIGGSGMNLSTSPTPDAAETLPSAVARQVGDLTADFEGAGHEELPQPTPDLHTYADALASAMKNCKHETVTDTIHSRGEYFCEDCRKYLSRDDMKKRNAGGGYFRFFG